MPPVTPRITTWHPLIAEILDVRTPARGYQRPRSQGSGGPRSALDRLGDQQARVDLPQPDRLRILGAPAHQAPVQLVDAGRGEEDEQRVGHGLADLAGALQVDLQQGRQAPAEPLLDRGARGAVEVAGELGPFQQLLGVDEVPELRPVHEVVVLPVGLVLATRAGGHRDRQPHPSRARLVVVAHRLFVPCPAHLPAVNSPSSAFRCWSPSPRRRRLSAIFSFSMIWVARILPIPGSACSTAETLSLPTTSSVSARSRTAESVVLPDLSCSFSSARALRISAAFSSAAARCSGLSVGSGTSSPQVPRLAAAARLVVRGVRVIPSAGKTSGQRRFQQRRGPP